MHNDVVPAHTRSLTDKLLVDPAGGFLKPLLATDNIVVTRFKCGRKDLRLTPNPVWDKIVVCISGKRNLNSELNGEKAYNGSVDPWGICVIPADTEETVRSSSSDALGIYIHRSLLRRNLARQENPLDSSDLRPRFNHQDPVIKELATEMLLYANTISHNTLYTDSMAEFLLTRLQRSETAQRSPVTSNPSTNLPLALKTVVDYMHAEYQTEIRLEYLAVLAGVSPYQLSQLFRTYLDTSPHKYLIKIRMDCAGRLLRDTGKSVDEIRRETGHNSLQWFSTAFRNQYGVSPSKYRDMA